jgi:hypothetical protein
MNILLLALYLLGFSTKLIEDFGLDDFLSDFESGTCILFDRENYVVL